MKFNLSKAKSIWTNQNPQKEEHNYYLRHFTFKPINPISIRITREILHLLIQNPRKLIIHRISFRSQNRTSITPYKPLMNLFKKSKRNSPSNTIIRHTKHGESIGTFHVKNIPVLWIRNMCIVVSGDFLEDLPRNCGGVGCCAGELRENHRSTRHQRVEYTHFYDSGSEESDECLDQWFNWTTLLFFCICFFLFEIIIIVLSVIVLFIFYFLSCFHVDYFIIFRLR